MAYDLHITRREHWSDYDGLQIAYEEWMKFALNDSELIKDQIGDSESEPCDMILIDHPITPVPLYWYNGEVYAKNPDQQTVKKMISIAAKLDAQVVGDDDESYTDWTKYPQPSRNMSSKVTALFGKLFG
jgi:hypothetical protein